MNLQFKSKEYKITFAFALCKLCNAIEWERINNNSYRIDTLHCLTHFNHCICNSKNKIKSNSRIKSKFNHETKIACKQETIGKQKNTKQNKANEISNNWINYWNALINLSPLLDFSGVPFQTTKIIIFTFFESEQKKKKLLRFK